MITTDIMRMQYVNRWNTVNLTHSQSVAEHSYNVAVISMRLASDVGMCDASDTLSLLRAAIYHDIDEVVTGDIPTPTKRRLMGYGVPESMFSSYDLGGMSDLAISILHVADLMEAAFHVKQHGAGIHAEQVAASVLDMMEELIVSMPDKLQEACSNLWVELNMADRLW